MQGLSYKAYAGVRSPVCKSLQISIPPLAIIYLFSHRKVLFFFLHPKGNLRSKQKQ